MSNATPGTMTKSISSGRISWPTFGARTPSESESIDSSSNEVVSTAFMVLREPSTRGTQTDFPKRNASSATEITSTSLRIGM